MRIKKYEAFIEDNLVGGTAVTDHNLPHLERTRELSDEELLQILSENCKNFSFGNDLLWRCKDKKFDLELYEPAGRKAKPLAFPEFFNKIENDPGFPVARKKSLIGGTKPDIIKKLVCNDMYLVIPFDNSPIVFCPIVDLWALDDDRKRASEEYIDDKPVSGENFIMVNYTKDFKIPLRELSRLPKANLIHGSEFFTSSPCLMVYESRIDWLKSQLWDSQNRGVS